jgi:hypothetical protein
LFTTGTVVDGTIEVTVDTGSFGAPQSPTALTSGQAVRFAYNAVSQPTLQSGVYSYRIDVPEGASRMQVKVVSDDPKVDVDLYVRKDVPPEVVDGDVVADFASENETGNETITITNGSTPPLSAGTWYIAIGVYTTGSPATGTVSATVERGLDAPTVGQPIAPGGSISLDIPAVDSSTLFTGDMLTRIDVPADAQELRIDLRTNPSDVDLDLFVRYGAPPTVQNGRVVADYRSIGSTGDETVTVNAGSVPTLRPGTYYIAVASYTTGRTATANLTATLRGASSSAGPADINFKQSESKAILSKPKDRTREIIVGSSEKSPAIEEATKQPTGIASEQAAARKRWAQ